VLARGGDIVPIPGTSRRDHLDENLAALNLVLTAEDLARLERIAPVGAAAGLRYPEASLRQVNG
jgi:aryl-alcohol dehydrogenase-like predicted oxidoreductase